MNKGFAKFGIGALIGVQLVSETLYIGNTSVTSSDRGLTLGVNASVDIPVYKSLNFSVVPAYIQRVSGNNQIGEIQFNGAISFRF